jgi:hypothetical protein
MLWDGACKFCISFKIEGKRRREERREEKRRREERREDKRRGEERSRST